MVDYLYSPLPVPIADWNADDLVLNDLDPVVSWTDRQNGLILTGGVSPQYLADARATHPGVKCTGSEWLQVVDALFAAATDGLVIMVAMAERVGAGTSDTLCSIGTTAGLYMRVRSSDNQISIQDAGGFSLLVTYTNNHVPEVLSVRYERSQSYGMGKGANFVAPTSIGDISGLAPPVASSTFTLFKRDDLGTQLYSGTIHQITVYDANEIETWEEVAIQAAMRNTWSMPSELDTSPLFGDPGGGGGTPALISDVRLGVTYNQGAGDLIGNLRVPAIADVRSPVVFDTLDTLTGTLSLPLISDVRLGVVFDDGIVTGDVRVPTVAQVQDGVVFDTADSLTGTYDPAAAAVFPTESQTAIGVAFGPTGVDFTGNVTLPPVGEVIEGAFFGPSVSLFGTYEEVGVNEVKIGVMYGEDGLQYTGTYDPLAAAVFPTEAQTAIGVTFGPTGAEFTGNVSLPSVNDVRLSTTFGSLLSLTGNVTLPIEATVQLGVTYDTLLSRTGTLAGGASQAAVTDVRLGIIYNDGNSTGLLVVPTEATVTLGTNYDVAPQAKTGDVTIPVEATVQDGVTYGSLLSQTGTYDPAASSVFPLESQVLLGVTFGPTGADSTGDVTLPSVNDVRLATTFGSLLSLSGLLAVPLPEFVLDGVATDNTVGTYVAVTETNVRLGVLYGDASSRAGLLDLPSVNFVQLGTVFDNTTKTGNSRQAPIENVLLGFDYGSLDSLTGTLDPDVGGPYPIEDDVRSGVTYATASTGNMVEPSVADVRAGTTFGSSSSLVGLIEVPRVGRVITGVLVDQTVGTFDYPVTTDVRNGVTYGEDGTEFTGSLIAPTAPTFPLVDLLFTVYHNGTPVEGATVRATLQCPNSTAETTVQTLQITDSVTDSSGLATLTLIQKQGFTTGGIYDIAVLDPEGKLLSSISAFMPDVSNAAYEDLVNTVYEDRDCC